MNKYMSNGWRTPGTKIPTNDKIVNKIQTAIRLKQDGYKEMKCPNCGEKPFVERSLRNKGYLMIRCKCGLLNMCEKGI